jgi:hypothetical protein
MSNHTTSPLHRFLLPLLVALGLLAAPARAQSFSWAKKVSTSVKSAVAADRLGNSYTLSSFTGTVTVGNKTYTSLGAADLLLTRYKGDGTVDWVRRIGGAGNEQVGDLGVTVDGAGDLRLVGSFQSTVFFETYSNLPVLQLTSAGKYDVFVAEYYLNGTSRWVRRAGGPGDDFGHRLDSDQVHNLYVTGYFTETATFSSGGDVYMLKSSGDGDLFLAKFASGGDLKYARRLGGAGRDYGMSVAVDQPTGDVYLTGVTSPVTHPKIPNVLVVKYDPQGKLQWQKTTGTGGSWEQGNDVAVTPSGIYVTGFFSGNITFDNTTLTSKGGEDAFVVHYPFAANGTADWAKNFGGALEDKAYDLAYFPWDNGQTGGDLYLSGSFSGSAAFGALSVTATGGAADEDMFVTRLSPNGTPGWVKKVGGTSHDDGSGHIALRNSNTLYLTGRYGGSVTLGATTLTGPGVLMTRIDLPTVNDFHVIDATKDLGRYTLFPQSYFAEINYMTLGTNQINIRANVTPGSTNSVKFTLDGVSLTDAKAPFTWAGDLPKFGGGTDYLAFTPTLGEHTLVATPYAGANGTGVKGLPQTIKFVVINKPVVTGITHINALTDQDIPVNDGEGDEDEVNIDYKELGTNRINIRANVNPTTVGSVKFVLNGVTRIENGAAPYSWGGDQPKAGGGIDYHSVTLPEGSYNLVVTAYTGPNATGIASKPYSVSFYVYVYSGLRVAAAEPEVQPVALQAAPNPFADRTSLSFTAAEDGPAVVEIYNAQGMPVTRLFEGSLVKGKAYQWEFDGTRQPGGLYFARLKAGNRVVHQRLVLSK